MNVLNKELRRANGKQDVLETLPQEAVNDALALHPMGFKLTDLGNAERLVARNRDRIRYCASRGWFVWGGRCWRLDETDAVTALAKQTVRAIYGEAEFCSDDEQRRAIAKHATASERVGRIQAMVSLARSDPSIVVRQSELDADPWLLNCENGTVDLRTGKLRPHAQSDLITKLAPVAYDAKAECPTWLAFLSRVLNGSESLMDFMQRFAGYSLTGDVSVQVMVVNYGKGRNGKSTYQRVMLRLLGDYGIQAAPELLLMKRGETHPTEVADLVGRRLAVCTEIEQGRAFAEVTVKQLTGGDRIKARFMRCDFFEFEPTHKLMIATNHKPRVRGTDFAIWRRILLVPWTVTISDAECDPALPDKLTAELPGILRWAVDGCLAWQRDGLRIPDEVRAATAEYKAESDQVGRFIDECCEVKPELSAEASELHKAYVAWAERNGENAMKQRSFGETLAERELQREKDSQTRRALWKGIGLRSLAKPSFGMTERNPPHEALMPEQPFATLRNHPQPTSYSYDPETDEYTVS